MKNHYRGIRQVFLAVSLVCLVASSGPAQRPSVTVGVVIDGPWERNEEIRETFEREIAAVVGGRLRSSAGGEASSDRLVSGASRGKSLLKLGRQGSCFVARALDRPGAYYTASFMAFRSECRIGTPFSKSTSITAS